MTHEERARKIANLINSQKFSGLLEDLLAAEFAEVERYPVHSDCEHGNCQLCIILHEAERENLDRIAQLEKRVGSKHFNPDNGRELICSVCGEHAMQVCAHIAGERVKDAERIVQLEAALDDAETELRFVEETQAAILKTRITLLEAALEKAREFSRTVSSMLGRFPQSAQLQWKEFAEALAKVEP